MRINRKFAATMNGIILSVFSTTAIILCTCLFQLILVRSEASKCNGIHSKYSFRTYHRDLLICSYKTSYFMRHFSWFSSFIATSERPLAAAWQRFQLQFTSNPAGTIFRLGQDVIWSWLWRPLSSRFTLAHLEFESQPARWRISRRQVEMIEDLELMTHGSCSAFQVINATYTILTVLRSTLDWSQSIEWKSKWEHHFFTLTSLWINNSHRDWTVLNKHCYWVRHSPVRVDLGCGRSITAISLKSNT